LKNKILWPSQNIGAFMQFGFSSLDSFFLYSIKENLQQVLAMTILVVEFSRGGYKIRKVFVKNHLDL
jgi:hypothetical protein